MKKLNAISILLICMLSVQKISFAQIQILPLRYNQSLFDHKKPASVRNAVPLPFEDDFSYPGPDPDPNLWQNNGALVNFTFPLNPVTYGVATLDGLNGNGIPYDTLSFNFNAIGSADTLASMPVLLGSYTPADSIYFSFFYQPGGIGDVPNSAAYNQSNFNVPFGDSLILEFKDSSGFWHPAWERNGDTVQSGYTVKPFVQVSIKISDLKYFHDDFQFRFRNYATLVGNYDQWHIDYVRLKSYPTGYNPAIADVAIQYYPTSILKNYEAMPWNQFFDYQKTEKAPFHVLTVRNNGVLQVVNVTKQFVAFEDSNPPFYASDQTSDNIDPQSSKVLPLDSFAIPFFAGNDITITTKYWITSDTTNKRNDTINRIQQFSNYLAYDDGSAEATARLLGSPASLAVKFHLNKPDTLQAVGIHFSNTDEDISQNVFSLIVWSKLTDSDTLYRDDFLKPAYSKSYNGFSLYRLSHPVLVSDTFYVGWQQTSLANDVKIDVGFDLNDTANNYVQYNIFGEWNTLEFPGAVMVRPYLGGEIPFGVGIDDVNTAENDITIFPNPAFDILNVKSNIGHSLALEVLDYTGSILLSENNSQSISVSRLPAGLYLLKAIDTRDGTISIHKFIKAK